MSIYCMRLLRFILLILAGLTGCVSSYAESVAVAVAANFHRTMQVLAAKFEMETGHDVTLISGSTGGLYAQIVNGAPYDLFIAADSRRPALLGASGAGVEQSQATVASGRLVLWSADPELLAAQDLNILRDERLRFLAVTNPDLAPYGEAARQALVRMQLWEMWSGRLVYGTNVAQTYAMVTTGNAELGLVALSQVLAESAAGAYLVVPQEFHEPIRQDIILLQRGADNTAAIALLEFLSAPESRTVISRFGYRVAD